MAYQANWKRTALLAAGLFVFGAFAYWLEYSYKPKSEDAEEQSKRVFSLEDTAVKSIRLVSGSKTLEFECLDLDKKLCKPGDQSAWRINEPRKLQADQSNVNSLLSTLRHLSSTETVNLAEETPEKRESMLEQYGLSANKRSNPRFKRIEVVTADGKRMAAYLGEEHPVGGKLFTGYIENDKFDENRILIVPSHVTSNFDKDLSYWREKKLLTLNSADITGFSLDGASKVSAARKDGGWVISSGTQKDIAGDTEDIDSLLSSVTYLRAKDFASDDRNDARARAALSGAKKKLTISLTKTGDAKDASEITLTFFEKPGKGKDAKPSLYATVSGLDPVFELESSAMDRLNKTLKDLRLSKLLTSMERFTARRLAFDGAPLGGKKLVIKQEGSEWKFDGREAKLDTDAVQKFLDRMTGDRIEEFLTGSAIPAGSDKGLTFILGDEKEQEKRKFVFWKSKGKLYARDLGSTRGEAYRVQDAVAETLPWKAEHFDLTAKKEADKAAQKKEAQESGHGDHDGHGHEGHSH